MHSITPAHARPCASTWIQDTTLENTHAHKCMTSTATRISRHALPAAGFGDLERRDLGRLPNALPSSGQRYRINMHILSSSTHFTSTREGKIGKSGPGRTRHAKVATLTLFQGESSRDIRDTRSSRESLFPFKSFLEVFLLTTLPCFSHAGPFLVRVFRYACLHVLDDHRSASL